MPDSEIFASHAARCRIEATEATLDNVRERALRSEAAWAAMAQRSSQTEAARSAREAGKAHDAAPLAAGPIVIG